METPRIPVYGPNFEIDLFTGLKALKQAEQRPLFMDELGAYLTAHQDHLGKGFISGSSQLFGKTPQGTMVTAFVHVPTSFSSIEGLLGLRLRDSRDWYANSSETIIGKNEFRRALALDGKVSDGTRLVTVMDYENLIHQPCEVTTIENALAHPLTIPFFGSEPVATTFLRTYFSNFEKLRIQKYFRLNSDQSQPKGGILECSRELTHVYKPGCTSSQFVGLPLIYTHGRDSLRRAAETPNAEEILTAVMNSGTVRPIDRDLVKTVVDELFD